MAREKVNGKYSIPAEIDNGTYALLAGRRGGKTASMNGIKIDHVARVGDHFEVDYTVTNSTIIKKLRNQPRVSCSLSYKEMVLEDILKGKP